MRDLLAFSVGAIGLVFWVIAANIVITRQYKRRGMAPESGWGIKPDFFSHLNAAEWGLLGLTTIAALAAVLIGVAIAGGLHAI